MNIKCIGAIGIVHTRKVPYIYKREGYYVGDRYVKAKNIRKWKDVPLKDPYLSGDIKLEVDERLMVGGVYEDENGKQYICYSYQNFTTPLSNLKIRNTNLGKTFSAPTKLTLVSSSFS